MFVREDVVQKLAVTVGKSTVVVQTGEVMLQTPLKAVAIFSCSNCHALSRESSLLREMDCLKSETVALYV